ncbi:MULTISPECIES: hypothetical protein [Micromonospora]|uniref:Uncharacterized protein n=1 Tax=Micromonospora sicca TaxID=2202420 RepID=A0A317D131_9ACTN|nr:MULTISPECIES: hypothetical protein [unclassified Micromonospora]MBM0228706.1 hypothetical protein [Micromonospora sp. ATA51]PWR07900.1 hypothetical protein DKT69_33830 [Micromonospora sp. 4G51]
MSRWRLARIAGAILVLGTLFCLCGVLAVARPGRPRYDVEAENAAFTEVQTWVLLVGGLLVLAGVVLGVAGAIGENGPLPGPHRGRESSGDGPAAGERGEPGPEA